jgi:hypothetical protein
MRQVLARLLIGTTLLTACGGSGFGADDAGTAAAPDRVESETARLNRWFDDRYEEYLQRHPIATTRIGRKDNYDRIDDMTEAAEASTPARSVA